MNTIDKFETFRRGPSYLDLDDKQRVVLDTFLACGDKKFSVQSALKMRDAEEAFVVANEMFADPKMIRAVDDFFGTSDQIVQQRMCSELRVQFDPIFRDLEAMVYGPETVSEWEVWKLKARLKSVGWTRFSEAT